MERLSDPDPLSLVGAKILAQRYDRPKHLKGSG